MPYTSHCYGSIRNYYPKLAASYPSVCSQSIWYKNPRSCQSNRQQRQNNNYQNQREFHGPRRSLQSKKSYSCRQNKRLHRLLSMIKVFLDTNIFLRFMVPENETSFQECERVASLAESGQLTPYTSSVVIQEIIYTLNRTYKFPRQEILSKLTLLFKLRNLTLLEKTNTPLAFTLFQKYNIKFGDCLIATQVPPKITICTYDPDFAKIPNLRSSTPSQLISQLTLRHPSH